MAQALKIEHLLGSGVEGVIYAGRLGTRAVVIKISHIDPEGDINDLMRDRLAFTAAVADSPFFSHLLQIAALPGHEYKHPLPEFIREGAATDKARRRKFPWYFALHESTQPVLQEIYTPICIATARTWLEQHAGNTSRAYLRELYSYVAQMCVAFLTLEHAGWCHSDMHNENIMYMSTRAPHIDVTIGRGSRIRIPLAGKQWIVIDYGNIYRTTSKPTTPQQRRLAKNPHTPLAGILDSILYQPFFEPAQKAGLLPPIDQLPRIAQQLIKRNPSIGLPPANPVHAEPITYTMIVMARAIRLDPGMFYDVFGLKDAPYPRLLAAHKAGQVIPDADFKALTRHICNPRAMLTFLTARLRGL